MKLHSIQRALVGSILSVALRRCHIREFQGAEPRDVRWINANGELIVG